MMLMTDFILRPMTKEIVLLLIHYEPENENERKLISESFIQFRKQFTKRLNYLKKQFEEEDWEIINYSNTYVSYFLSYVSSTNIIT